MYVVCIHIYSDLSVVQATSNGNISLGLTVNLETLFNALAHLEDVKCSKVG